MALVHSLSPIFSMEDEIFLLKYLYRGGGGLLTLQARKDY